MTTKQQVALQLHASTLRVALGTLERAETTADECGAGHDEVNKLAIRCGAFEQAAKMVRDDLRKAIRELEQRFPAVRR